MNENKVQLSQWLLDKIRSVLNAYFGNALSRVVINRVAVVPDAGS